MGRVWKFGDKIDTDAITPGTKNLVDNLREACFCEHRPLFREEVEKGDIILGGESFGCGSSRETAPLSIQESGVEAVLATSFARIFRQNSTAIGLHTVVVPEEAYTEIEDGAEAEVDVYTGRIQCNGSEYQGTVQGRKTLAIIEAGGKIPYLKSRGWRY